MPLPVTTDDMHLPTCHDRLTSRPSRWLPIWPRNPLYICSPPHKPSYPYVLYPPHSQWQLTSLMALTPSIRTSSLKSLHQPRSGTLGFLPERDWDPFLKTLLDPYFADFLRKGICDGFCLGVSPSATLVSSKAISLSALSSMVDNYIEEEVKAGNLAPSPCEGVHLSPFGFIPKKNRPGKFRLIVNLSFPSGNSINGTISPAHSSCYITVHQVVEQIPQGSFLAKIDLKAAFQSTPHTSIT